MHIARRQFLAGAACLALAGSIGAAAAEPVTLSAPWMGWPEEQVAPLMEAFEKETGIKVSAERLPIAELFRTLEVRLQARNELPDVYLVDGPLTASYAARGHLEPLDDLLADDLDRFVPTTLEQGTYDGKLYAMPLGSSAQLLYYNKALFEEAGIPLPSSDPEDRMTWEEVLEIARKLTKPDIGQFGFAFENTNPYQLLPVPLSMGAKVIGEDGLSASGIVDGPDMVEAMTWYQDLFQKEKVAPVGTFQTGVTQEMFGSGKLAMMVGGTWNLVGFEKFDGLDFGVAPHPYFEGGEMVTPTGSWHVGINPRTAHKAEAEAFVKWLSTKEAMNLWFELRKYPPALEAIWDERDDTTFADPEWKIVRYDLANTATPRPATPAYREYEDFLKTAMQDIQTGADVQDALTRAAQGMDREMRKYR